jgi:alanine racemase
MDMDRRGFVGSLVAGGLVVAERERSRAPGAGLALAEGAGGRGGAAPADRFDPWIEVDPAALAWNVGVVSRLTAGRPIIAVIKNNAYGLGLTGAAGLLETHAAVAGFAVVKPDDALALRAAGIRKPVLLMGMAPDEQVRELVRAGVHLSLFLPDDASRLPGVAGVASPIPVHLYVDTGMGRMGLPYHRALPWLDQLGESRAFQVDGMFTEFTEEADFDAEQLRRLLELTDAARTRGLGPGRVHAASSNGVYHLPAAHLDLVRPGIALFGGYPSRPDEERAKGELRPGVRLRCRVVRVERLRPGDSVSYGRNYIAERPTWVATLPAGHADGYPRGAVNGARILIGERTYAVIGAVSASHIVVEVGDEPTVSVGDVATLVGPDHPDVHPNEVARASSGSVYDIFMHLNPALPRIVV